MFPLSNTKVTANQEQSSSDCLLVTQDSTCAPISCVVTYILLLSAEKIVTHLSKADIVLARKA